ncbi:hypothetical protein B0T14DRAFT_463325 [Immersiella caudata]|uniref:Short-chain dehydrogenase/reductase n=1 Tax=Immersiella caudata TaxID=314043 RepID=A0AA40BV39_9PEZI|nr:hypothetical protein B0T14DRAFT_463325 [Immersiella caudata]
MFQFQASVPPTPGDANVNGKTIIVTGANSGLGFEAVRQFVLLGASRVILACRSLSRGQEAVVALRSDPEIEAHNASVVFDVFELDLNDYQSGLRFSKRVKEEVKELDILLNNGGISLLQWRKSESGHEQTMQVNCYTHILICLELFPLLRKTAAIRGSPTRITFVGSATQLKQETMSRASIPPPDSILGYFDKKSTFSIFRYADSKLAVSAYTRRLAQLSPSEVIVNNLCPGLVQTGLDKNLPGVLRVLMGFVRKSAARTVQEGGRTLIHAAVVASAETNGKFLRNNKIEPAAAFLETTEGEVFIDRLWRETLQDVCVVDPELRSFTQEVGA